MVGDRHTGTPSRRIDASIDRRSTAVRCLDGFQISFSLTAPQRLHFTNAPRGSSRREVSLVRLLDHHLTTSPILYEQRFERESD